MRFYSFHPNYLDYDTLYLTWRRGLIAVRALTGCLRPYERRYQEHRQLIRFQAQPDPLQALCDYLYVVADAADQHGHRLKRDALPCRPGHTRMTVTAGQYEKEIWLYAKALKLKGGMIHEYYKLFSKQIPELHPIFTLISGAIEEWDTVGNITTRKIRVK